MRPAPSTVLGAAPIPASEFVACDVAVPAALSVITEQTAPLIDAKLVVEGANGPTTLRRRDPGGQGDPGRAGHPRQCRRRFTVSYFEWVQTTSPTGGPEKEVNDECTRLTRPERGHRLSRTDCWCTAAIRLKAKRVAEPTSPAVLPVMRGRRQSIPGSTNPWLTHDPARHQRRIPPSEPTALADYSPIRPEEDAPDGRG